MQFSDGRIPYLPIATCELQGYVDDAKLRVAELAERIMGNAELAARLRSEAATLRDRFNKAFWSDARGGYYAVGLALTTPQAVVHAFETSDSRRDQARELARANGVGRRVLMHGTCDLHALNGLEVSEPFVICDCEGCEVEVLDPAAVPSLRSATLIVELHDHLQPGTTEIVLGRFADSHDATLISSRPRNPAAYDELRGLHRREEVAFIINNSVGKTPFPRTRA